MRSSGSLSKIAHWVETLARKRTASQRSTDKSPTAKGQPGTLVKILNSAFFLWLLSAILFTIGGAYYTTYQRCTNDSLLIVDRFQKLARELHDRQRYIASATLASARIDDLRTKLQSIPYVYAEYKNRTLWDLQREFNKMRDKIHGLKEHALLVNVDDPNSFTPKEMTEYGSIVVGVLPQNINDDRDLPTIKKITAYFSNGLDDEFSSYASLAITRNCSIGRVLSLMQGHVTQITDAK